MTTKPKPRTTERWVHHLHKLVKRFSLGIEELVEMGVLTSQLAIGLPSRLQVTFDNKELISFIRSLLSRREEEVRERIVKKITSNIINGDKMIEIKKNIAGIAGILNGSTIHDTGLAVVAQNKLGNVLELLPQILDEAIEAVRGEK